ncbi:MAG: epoxyqueuosine reductase QueH [Eubacterium sp.]|nr:epoxyqueuosine reductase QueH [Eubacterium sp.]
MNNYYIEFEKQIDRIKSVEELPKLLLHACCAPCSTHCLEVLAAYFDITVYFYNPNIDEFEEYKKRLEELERLKKEADFAKNIKIVDGSFEPNLFYEMAKGRENLPERGLRCYDCYELRLRKTAEYALKEGFDYFSTTLSISPYKNAQWLNEIGIKLENEMMQEYEQKNCEDIKKYPIFLFSDFKKKNGYKRSIELSEEYGLYRQDYCGCIFSKRDRDAKKQK